MKIDSDNVAAFKDENGQVHSVSAVCSHMGCIFGWNETDRTWDCPCHGSRFELSGELIPGPATQPLGSKLQGRSNMTIACDRPLLIMPPIYPVRFEYPTSSPLSITTRTTHKIIAHTRP